MFEYRLSPSPDASAPRPERRRLEDADLGKVGYRFPFITVAGSRALGLSPFLLSRPDRTEGMTAHSLLERHELELEPAGYTAIRHQRGENRFPPSNA